MPGSPAKCSRSPSSRFVPMKPELTVLVMMNSEGRGLANGWKEKPGEEGCSGELGRVEACCTWIILWRGGDVEEAVDERSLR